MFSLGSRSKAKACPVPAADAIDRVGQLTENIIMKIRNASGIPELAKLCDSLQLVLEGLRAVQTGAAGALIPASPSPTTMPPGPATPAPMGHNPAYSWAPGLPQEAAPIPAQRPNPMTAHHMQAQAAVSVPQTVYHHPPLAHGALHNHAVPSSVLAVSTAVAAAGLVLGLRGNGSPYLSAAFPCSFYTIPASCSESYVARVSPTGTLPAREL